MSTVLEAKSSGEVAGPSGGGSNRTTMQKLVSDTGWMGLVVLLPLIGRLVVTPIRVRMMTPADFGDVSLWAAVLAVVGGFAVWPAGGLMRYLPAGSAEDRARIVRAWLLSTVATMAVATTAFAVWAVFRGAAWGCVALVAGLQVLVAAGECYARAIGRFRTVTAMALTGGLGGLTVGTLLIRPMGPVGVLVGWAGADVTAVLIGSGLLGRRILADLRLAPGLDLGRLLRFSAPLALSNGTWMLVTWLDRPMLSGLVTRSELGIYSFAYAIVAAPLSAVFVILSAVTWNHAVAEFENQSYKAAAELLDRSARAYVATATPIAVWLALNTSTILRVVAPRSYGGAERHVIWLAVGLWLFGLLPYRNQHLMLWGRSRAAAVPSVVALGVNILMIRLTVPHYGAVAAAAATGAAYAAATLAAAWICRRDDRVISKLPLRLTAGCFVMSVTAGVLLRPLVERGQGRSGEVLSLALSGVTLVVLSAAAEGSAWRLICHRLAGRRRVGCMT